MTLSCRRIDADCGERPWLVWLHGFLGSASDWQQIISRQRDWRCLAVDLPGHGASRDIATEGFEHTCQLLSETLQAQGISRYWLIGYSLGGRVAMYYSCRHRTQGLQGLIVEGGHPGLADRDERAQRVAHDRKWAARLRTEPLPQVLSDWYRQPVFADLDTAQRDALIARRSDNGGPALAAMLEATSLGRQPWLLPELQRLSLPFVWLCGQYDSKFQRLATDCALPRRTIVGAGHNAHLANPEAYASQLFSFISNSR